MEITEQKSAGVVTLRLSGRLDTTTAQAFEMSRVTGVVLSGLVASTVGCDRSSAWLP